MDIERKRAAIEDLELVEAFRKDDASAFNILVNKYKDVVFTVCLRYLGNREEADDCAQDTFVKVFRGLKDFRARSSFSTWLYSIAVNTCKNRLLSLSHRYQKKMARLDEFIETDDGCMAFEIADGTTPPAEELENRQQQAVIQNAINSLDVQQREILILRDIEGLSYEEIAEITANNPGTVKSRISRARLQLKERLKERKIYGM